ncbi:MAG: glycosyltransferase [Rubrivivax sp.]|nr:glycosyltransferase [Rubrivivax sp.]
MGSMLPFERLVRAADHWAASHPEVKVIAQTGGGTFSPRAMAHQAMYTPEEYRRHCAEADLIVSHLGMGTVITAAEVGRPLVALPRRRELAEVTSDHQTATAAWLRMRPGVTVIEDEDQLAHAIEAAAHGAGPAGFGQEQCDRLIACVRAFAHDAIQQR